MSKSLPLSSIFFLLLTLAWLNSYAEDDDDKSHSNKHARLESDNIIKVGITDFAQEELGDLVYIELPEVGRVLAVEEQCDWFHSALKNLSFTHRFSWQLRDCLLIIFCI
jgi:hypothetical protein